MAGLGWKLRASEINSNTDLSTSDRLYCFVDQSREISGHAGLSSICIYHFSLTALLPKTEVREVEFVHAACVSC